MRWVLGMRWVRGKCRVTLGKGRRPSVVPRLDTVQVLHEVGPESQPKCKEVASQHSGVTADGEVVVGRRRSHRASSRRVQASPTVPRQASLPAMEHGRWWVVSRSRTRPSGARSARAAIAFQPYAICNAYSILCI